MPAPSGRDVTWGLLGEVRSSCTHAVGAALGLLPLLLPAVRAGRSGLTPYQLLTAALDALVTAGQLPTERRAGAEFLAWSAVHGLSALAVDGPLRQLTDEQVRAIADRLVTMVEAGL